jgi:hypothetical protein
MLCAAQSIVEKKTDVQEEEEGSEIDDNVEAFGKNKPHI